MPPPRLTSSRPSRPLPRRRRRSRPPATPSAKLRTWYGHEVEKWPEFRRRYWAELKQQGDLLLLLKQRTAEGPVTFVYAASDEEHNSALALKEFLEKMK